MTAADFRVLLGMAFGALWGVAFSQALRVWVEGGNGWPWLILGIVGVLGMFATARCARYGGLRKPKATQ